VVKRSLLEPAPLAQATEFLWQHMPPCVVRGQPATYTDPHLRWEPSEPADLGVSGGRRVGETLQRGGSHFATAHPLWKLHAAGDQPFMLRLLVRAPPLLAIARQLLGSARVPSRLADHFSAPFLGRFSTSFLDRTRGIYTVFPQSSGATLSPHCDQGAQQLNTMSYLSEVLPCGGGFVRDT